PRPDAPRRAPAMRPELPAQNRQSAEQPLSPGHVPEPLPENRAPLSPPQPSGYQSPYRPTPPPVGQTPPVNPRTRQSNPQLPSPVTSWGTESQAKPRSAPRKSSNLEIKIGGGLFKFFGVIAIIVTAIFLLKSAYDNGVITPSVLIVVVAAFGIS